jgi:hypothetical protein
MASTINSVGSGGSVDDLIQAASTSVNKGKSSPGTFHATLGCASTSSLPMAGTIISEIVGKAAMDQAAFTIVSAVLKDRHEATMQAIRNAKG